MLSVNIPLELKPSTHNRMNHAYYTGMRHDADTTPDGISLIVYFRLHLI